MFCETGHPGLGRPPSDVAPPLQEELETLSAGRVRVAGLGASGLTAVSELPALEVKVVGLEAAGVASGAAGRNGGFLLARCSTTTR